MARRRLIAFWLDGYVPNDHTFLKWIANDSYPHVYKTWASITRLMLLHGINIRFALPRDIEKLRSIPHPLNTNNGFPFRTDLRLSMEQLKWLEDHPSTHFTITEELKQRLYCQQALI